MKSRRQERTISAEAARGAAGYLAESRSLGMSMIALLPLVVLYQVGIVQSGANVRNLAEVWLTGPFSLLGLHASTVLNVALAAGLLITLWKLEKRGSVCLTLMVFMVAEAMLYSLLLYSTAATAAHAVERRIMWALWIGRRPWGDLWLCLGAGVYEELLFRLLLLGGGAALLHKVFEFNETLSVAVMLVVSSLLFSAAHHIGPMRDQFSPFVFIFRSMCGLALGSLFLLRGLGITAWAHAMYNVLVLYSMSP